MRVEPFRIKLLLSLLIVAIGIGLWATGRLVTAPRAVIRWTTESEVDTAGFHVYRATSEEGTYERITEQLIRGEGDPFSGSEYRYEDRSVEPGQSYFYQLEELETSGVFTRLEETVRYDARETVNWPLVFALVVALLAPLLLIWSHTTPAPRPTEASKEEYPA